MLADVVLDTNVLMHADDERQEHQQAARRLLDDLLDGTTSLCVDDGFHPESHKNTSHIGHEYLEHLTGASTALPIIASLFANDRVEFVPRRVPPKVKKCIEQALRDKRDRTFLKVAYNSEDHVLCSHDYVDFSSTKRGHFEREIGVRILEVAPVRAMLTSTSE